MSYEALSEAILKGDFKGAQEETQKALDAGDEVQGILQEGLIAPMDAVGERFAQGLMFVPQMLRAAKTMQECLELLKPYFQEGAMTTKGSVVLGTVKGDLHDIGKNLVGMMLEGSGFQIIDLGVDVAPEAFVEKVKEIQPEILGMSALLSTTMPWMGQTIKALSEAGLRDKVKVIIGGAPVTSQYAQEIGADSYGADAGSAVIQAKKMLNL